MQGSLSQDDTHFLELAIKAAEMTFTQGNYPVGAVLVIAGDMVGASGNEIKGLKSYTQHAENKLFIEYGTSLNNAFVNNQQITLYTTLEPCIQCLGASVTNHINKIIYIQKDPNAGASELKHDNIGQWYKDTWPEIIHAPISDKPLEMMVKFFKQEIAAGNTKWPQKMLNLYGIY